MSEHTPWREALLRKLAEQASSRPYVALRVLMRMGDDADMTAYRDDLALALEGGAGALQRQEEARVILGDLIEWDAQMGGHEAPCWEKARKLRNRLLGIEDEPRVCCECGDDLVEEDGETVCARCATRQSQTQSEVESMGRVAQDEEDEDA